MNGFCCKKCFDDTKTYYICFEEENYCNECFERLYGNIEFFRDYMRNIKIFESTDMNYCCICFAYDIDEPESYDYYSFYITDKEQKFYLKIE